MVWISCNFYSQSTFHNIFSIFCIGGGDGSRGLCCWSCWMSTAAQMEIVMRLNAFRHARREGSWGRFYSFWMQCSSAGFKLIWCASMRSCMQVEKAVRDGDAAAWWDAAAQARSWYDALQCGYACEKGRRFSLVRPQKNVHHPIPMYCLSINALILTKISPLLNMDQASHQSRVQRLKPRLNHCRCLRLLSMTHLPHGKLDSVFFVFCVSLVVREIIRPGIPIPMYCVFVFRAHPNENSPPLSM